MKKNLKKLFAIIMTVAVVLSMAMPALAADPTITATTGEFYLTITPQNDLGDVVEYNIYQLLIANIDATNATIYSTVGAKNSDVLPEGTTIEQLSGYKNDLSKLWEVVQKISTSGQDTYGVTKDGKITIKDAGYYLAVPNDVAGTASDKLSADTVSGPILVAVPDIKGDSATGFTRNDNVTVTAKSSAVDTEKKITDVTGVNGASGTVSDTGDTATAGAGDTIQYTITNGVPTYTADVVDSKVNFYVVDKYDDNLTLKLDEDDNPIINVTTPTGLSKGTGVETVPVTTMEGGSHDVYRVTGGDYWVKTDPTAHTFTIYFNYEKIKPAVNGASEVTFTADFTLNNTAVPGTEIPNTSMLNYTNNYYTGQDGVLEDKVNSWTFRFNVYKYDTAAIAESKATGANGSPVAPLANAVFELFKAEEDGSLGATTDAEGNSTAIATAKSGTDGLANFNLDLNEGTYYVKEKTAPAGYRVDETVYKVVIKANKATEYDGDCVITVYSGDGDTVGTVISTEVQDGAKKLLYTSDSDAIDVLGIGNTPGTTLPGTGGIGTTIFTFGGLALIVLAGILLVVYTRKQKKAKA